MDFCKKPSKPIDMIKNLTFPVKPPMSKYDNIDFGRPTLPPVCGRPGTRK